MGAFETDSVLVFVWVWCLDPLLLISSVVATDLTNYLFSLTDFFLWLPLFLVAAE